MVCINRNHLKKISAEYVSLVVSGINSITRVEKHKLLSRLTGISYNELRKYLWNLDKYGYTPELEQADWDYARAKILQIAEGLADDILYAVEDRIANELLHDETAIQDLLRHGYTIEDWITEWKENGHWLCDGEPALTPDF